jgi:hypothetical protein
MLKTLTADRSNHERNKDGQSVRLDSVDLSERSQLMTAATDVPSVIDVAGVIVEDNTVSYEDETNNPYQSLPQSSSTEAASSVEPTEGQPHLTSSSGQANCSAQFKRK